MSKKDKKIKKLRRELEVLKAQMKGVGGLSPEVPPGTPTPSKPSTPANISGDLRPSKPSSDYVQTDLRRSLIITTVIVAIIGGLAVSQPYWSKTDTPLARLQP